LGIIVPKSHNRIQQNNIQYYITELPENATIGIILDTDCYFAVSFFIMLKAMEPNDHAFQLLVTVPKT